MRDAGSNSSLFSLSHLNSFVLLVIPFKRNCLYSVFMKYGNKYKFKWMNESTTLGVIKRWKCYYCNIHPKTGIPVSDLFLSYPCNHKKSRFHPWWYSAITHTYKSYILYKRHKIHIWKTMQVKRIYNDLFRVAHRSFDQEWFRWTLTSLPDRILTVKICTHWWKRKITNLIKYENMKVL